jgi:hypothetical protein
MRNDEVGTEVSKWNRFLTHGFPAHADVYTFRTRNEHSTCPQTLEEQVVRGRRPLYDSLAEVVKNPSNSGKTITVVSDGRDDASVATPEAIIADANKLNIKINILAIGLYDETADKEEAAMQKLAEATGGSFFIRRSECECD